MNIEALTIGEARQIAALIGGSSGNSTSVRIGQAYLFRGANLYHLGRVVAITDTDFVLDEAGWVPETGRFWECVALGKLNEYEPMGDGVIVSRASLSDATPWKHSLPKEAK